MADFFKEKQGLRTVWQKFAASTLLGAGAAVNLGSAFAKDPEPPPVAVETEAEPAPLNLFRSHPLNPPKEGPLTEQDRRDAAINAALMDDAQKRYAEMMRLGETPYAAELKALEAGMNENIRQFGASRGHTRGVVLDPYHFDTGMALGFTERETVQKMLDHKGITEIDDREFDDVVARMGRTTTSLYGFLTQTQEASAHDDGTANACMLIPTSDHGLLYPIPGMTMREQVDFINAHETRHCLNTKFTQTWEANEEVNAARVNGEWDLLVQNDRVLQLYSGLIKAETYSDVAGAADRIRAGDGLHIIDALRQRRGEIIEDTNHLSVFALDALKAHIEKVGLENFRKMPQADAEKLYNDITDNHGVSPKMLHTVYSWYVDEKNPGALREAAKTDPEVARGIEMLKYFPDLNSPPPPLPDPALTPAEKASQDRVMAFKPMEALEERAFKIAGKATPESYIRAYAALQTEFRADALKTADPEIAEKMTYLQTMYMHHMWEVDFAAINRNHGVNITALEPSLGALRTPLPVLPAGPKGAM